MYLICALQEHSAERSAVLSSPKPGPDILIEYEGQRVWIEAVVATNGVTGHPDAVVERNPDAWGKIPEEKLVLRYTNAISEKYRKYRGYLRDGILHQNDAFVIAMSGSALSYKFVQAEGDPPRFLKAVYPVGPYELLLDKRTGEIVGQQNESRFSIAKTREAPVATMAFLERRSRGISAILGSFADPGVPPHETWSDFELAHNPMSRTPIADFVFPAKRDWRAVLNENGGELTGKFLVSDLHTPNQV